MIGLKMLRMVMVAVIGALVFGSLACSGGSETVRLATEGQYHPSTSSTTTARSMAWSERSATSCAAAQSWTASGC